MKKDDQEAKNRPKIQEVETKLENKVKMNEDSKEPESETPSPSKAGKSNITKTLDKETIEKASAVATEAANESVLKSIPKTSAGLEKDFNQLKKNSSNVYQYLN